jgi:NADPH-dependent curcumin reductase CurA
MNRQWVLSRRPDGPVTDDCFAYCEVPRTVGPAAPGTIMVRNELLLFAPTIRNWISGERDSYYPTVEIGAPVMAPALGRIIESDNPDWPAGTRVICTGAWQDEQWVDPQMCRKVPEDLGSVDAMGICGLNALTAYAGLLHVGRPEPRETVLVSGAAGSVGSVAAQIARIAGCRVIGLCGGAAKAGWLRETCGIPLVIDYKIEDVPARLDMVAPGGIDVYFDNVGGTLLGDVVARLRRRGRVVLCGQIATYDTAVKTAGLNMMRIIYGGIRLEGFLSHQHASRFPEAMAQLREWDAAGLIRHREDVRDGFAGLPRMFRSLFEGTNNGTLLGRICDEAGNRL